MNIFNGVMKQCLICIVFFLSLNSFCQTASIKGFVCHGLSNMPSKYITIGLYQNKELIKPCKSDSSGYFIIENIRPGEYELKFSTIGYSFYLIPKIQLFADSTLFIQANYPCPNKGRNPKKICPYGHKDDIIPISYGLPSDKMLKKAEKRKCFLSGCMVSECNPKWHCTKHKINF